MRWILRPLLHGYPSWGDFRRVCRHSPHDRNEAPDPWSKGGKDSMLELGLSAVLRWISDHHSSSEHISIHHRYLPQRTCSRWNEDALGIMSQIITRPIVSVVVRQSLIYPSPHACPIRARRAAANSLPGMQARSSALATGSLCATIRRETTYRSLSSQSLRCASVLDGRSSVSHSPLHHTCNLALLLPMRSIALKFMHACVRDVTGVLCWPCNRKGGSARDRDAV